MNYYIFAGVIFYMSRGVANAVLAVSMIRGSCNIGAPTTNTIEDIMPELIIETNIPRSKVPADFLNKAVSLLAQTVDRQKELTVVAVHPDALMNFGGSDAPTAIARVVVVDRLGREENKRYSKALFDFIEKELGVPRDRLFITFEEKLARDFGIQGTTLDTIL